MAVNEDRYYFLNWELIPKFEDLIDLTQGNEILEVAIQDINGCRPTIRYSLPIVQKGQSFTIIRANLLFPKDICSKPLKPLYVSVRIVRGLERQVIYANEYLLAPPNYATGGVFRMPIYRVWYWEDYVRLAIIKLFP